MPLHLGNVVVDVVLVAVVVGTHELHITGQRLL